jgi:hypothetical protein
MKIGLSGVIMVSMGVLGQLGAQTRPQELPVLWTLGDSDSEEWDQFGYVSQIGLDAQDRVWVLDALSRHVRRYDAGGRLTLTVGRRGYGPGEFQEPFRMAVGEDFLAVRDLAFSRYLLFDTSGAWKGSINAPPDRSYRDPMVAVGHEFFDARRIWADSISPHFLYRFPAADQAQVTDSLEIPYSEHRVVGVPMDVGRFRWVDQPFAPLHSWAVLPDGRVLIPDTTEYLIEVYSKDKTAAASTKIAEIRRPARHVAIPREKRDSVANGAEQEVREYARQAGVSPAPFLRLLKVPEVYPEILDLHSDRLGRLWVHVPSDSDAEALYEVLEADGTLIGTVSIDVGGLPVNPKVFAASERMLVVGVLAPNDVHWLRAFRLPADLGR